MTKTYTIRLHNDDGLEVEQAQGRGNALTAIYKHRSVSRKAAARASGYLAGQYHMTIDGGAFDGSDIFYLYPATAEALFRRMDHDGVAETLAAYEAAVSDPADPSALDAHEKDTLAFLGLEDVYGLRAAA